MESTTLTVTPAPVGLDGAYHLTGQAWAAASEVTSQPPTDTLRLVMTRTPASLDAGWLSVVVANTAGVVTIAPSAAAAPSDIITAGRLCAPNATTGPVGGYSDLLASVFNTALAASNQEVRVSASKITAGALVPVLSMFPAAHPANLETVLIDTRPPYEALTVYSFAVLVAIALENANYVSGRPEAAGKKIYLSDSIDAPPPGTSKIVKITFEPGAFLHIPVSYDPGPGRDISRGTIVIQVEAPTLAPSPAPSLAPSTAVVYKGSPASWLTFSGSNGEYLNGWSGDFSLEVLAAPPQPPYPSDGSTIVMSVGSGTQLVGIAYATVVGGNARWVPLLPGFPTPPPQDDLDNGDGQTLVHVALERYNNRLYFYRRGVPDDFSFTPAATEPVVGLFGPNPWGGAHLGRIGGARISNVARYAPSPCTPPTTFTQDANTVFLLGSNYDDAVLSRAAQRMGSIEAS